MNNEVLKNLLKEDRKALKALNEVFHIDYNKPFQAVYIKGNTTIKQILKKLTYDNRTQIIVISRNPSAFCTIDRDFHVAMIDDKEKAFIDLPKNYFHCSFYSYHRLSDFRENLKSKESEHYIIAFQFDDTTPDKKYTVDTKERQKLLDIRGFRYSNSDNTYISSIYVADKQGKSIEYHPYPIPYYNYQDFTEVNQFMDKSGYIFIDKRNELYRKAKEIKAEKAKNAYLATDNTEKIHELSIRIKAKKLEIIELLKVADSAKALDEVGEILGERSWHGLSQVMHEYEKMLTGIQEKSYSSIDDFNGHYEKINNLLLNLGKGN